MYLLANSALSMQWSNVAKWSGNPHGTVVCFIELCQAQAVYLIHFGDMDPNEFAVYDEDSGKVLYARDDPSYARRHRMFAITVKFTDTPRSTRFIPGVLSGQFTSPDLTVGASYRDYLAWAAQIPGIVTSVPVDVAPLIQLSDLVHATQ